jgi:hypothetical protein
MHETLRYLNLRFDAEIPERLIGSLATVRVPMRHRVVNTLRMDPERYSPIMGRFAYTLSWYLERTGHLTSFRVLAGFPGFLRNVWGLRSLLEVPGRAGRYGVAMLRRRFKAHRAEVRSRSTVRSVDE